MMNQTEEKIKFSVVLPIYNVEKYLNRCLDSVMNQTYKKLEIILVDDGSPDNCPQMCDNWAKVDDRIKVVHKKNAGLGEARNSGLDVATGDYIAFFDSDDYIDTRLFEELYTVIISDNPDLIEFGHHDVDRQGNITKTFIPKTPLEKYEGEEVLSKFLPELICTDPKTGTASDLLMSAWSCLYRRQLLVECNFHFVSEREYISEDVYSLMKLMPNVHSVSVVQKAYYYYCENDQSLTHVYKPDRFEKLVAFQLHLEELCASDVYSDEVRYRIKRPFFSFFQSDFYRAYGDYNYRWFTNQWTYLECGIIGFGLYVFFFVTLIITLLAKLKRYSNASRPYMITSAIFTVAMIFLMWHSSAIRVDTAYIIYFGMAIGFVAMQYDSNEIKEDC